MKKYISVLSLILVGLSFLVSCSQTSDPAITSALIGTWYMENTSGTETRSWEYIFYTNRKLVVTTTTNGVLNPGSPITFTWSATEDELTLIIGTDSETVLYSIVGDVLTITASTDHITLIKQP